uniref:hypothetical protein n=1 Tax=Candidatus Fimivicinus sp. TaxID=3056640 RepID=UPI003FEF099C
MEEILRNGIIGISPSLKRFHPVEHILMDPFSTIPGGQPICMNAPFCGYQREYLQIYNTKYDNYIQLFFIDLTINESKKDSRFKIFKFLNNLFPNCSRYVNFLQKPVLALTRPGFFHRMKPEPVVF